MASKQEVFRERVVQFYELHRNLGKKYMVQHFKSENVAASTVYHILRSPTTARKQGSGRPAKIMDAKGLRSLSRAFNNKESLSQKSSTVLTSTSAKHWKELEYSAERRHEPRNILTHRFQRWIPNAAGWLKIIPEKVLFWTTKVTSLFRRRRFPETIDTIQRIVVLYLRT